MPTLQLTQQQVIELAEQLPPEGREALRQFLLGMQWPRWSELSREAQPGAVAAARQRGRDWATMTPSERESFIDDVVHEDHPCGR